MRGAPDGDLGRRPGSVPGRLARACALTLVAATLARVGANAREHGGASGAQEHDVASAAFLAGCWESALPDGGVEEVWTAPKGGVMVGLTRTVRGGRARGWEHLLLSVKEGRLTYTALPSGQALTDFGMTDAGAGHLVFTNPEHDFPRKIEYRAVSPDSVHALVYGEVEAAEPAFGLRYGRVACAEVMGEAGAGGR